MQRKHTILIVDDERISRETLQALLWRENYTFKFAASGQDALNRLPDVMPDAILLDIMMPNMDGFEVCKKLKNDKKWRHIPIIIVTALNSKDDLSLGISAGADDFLIKPVNGIELRARVRSMLRIKDQYDELEKTLALRETLADMIVHDMRTPLSSILGFSELLTREQICNSKGISYAQTIQTQAARLNTFLNDMLILAKIEQGQPLVNRSAVDINLLINETIINHQVIAQSKKITLATNLSEQADVFSIDAHLFQRVLDNLLSNALKFSPIGGTVTLQVNYPVAPDGTQKLQIQVVDEGPGIPQSEQIRIFNKYEIVDAGDKNILQIGLGLPFCKMVVEAHNGCISVANNSPSGAIFTIDL